MKLYSCLIVASSSFLSVAPALAADNGQGDRKVTAGLTLKIAPTIGDSLPLELGDGLNDYKNATSLMLNLEAPLGPLAWETQAGVKLAHNLNDSEKNASSLVFNNAVRLYRGFRRFSPFIYGNVEVGYSDFLDKGTGDTLEYGAGTKVELLSGTFGCQGVLATDECFASSPESMSLALTLQVGRSDSGGNVKDYWGPKANLSFFQKFARNRLTLKLEGEFEHKRFDDLLGFARKDDQLILSGGVDLARWIFPDSPGIKSVQLGGRWIKSWSNHPDGQADKLQFVPVLSIGTSF